MIGIGELSVTADLKQVFARCLGRWCGGVQVNEQDRAPGFLVQLFCNLTGQHAVGKVLREGSKRDHAVQGWRFGWMRGKVADRRNGPSGPATSFARGVHFRRTSDGSLPEAWKRYTLGG